MFYVPKEPFQTPEENANNFNSPLDRGIKFENVYVTTKDKVKLHGWYMSLDFN